MRLIISIITIFLISCNSLKENSYSFWATQKNDFRYQDKNEFVSDNTLREEYKTCKKIRHALFDSTIGGLVALYSWQNRDKTKNEFTVIKDDGELGLKMFYFILDKNDHLLSRTQIAGKGGEAGYIFETKSRFIGKDTLLNIGAVTQFIDPVTQQKVEKTKGDSTFKYLVINNSGDVTEKVFKEVKELHFGNE